jgi:hypothetical protein
MPPRRPAAAPKPAADWLVVDGCNFLGCAPGYKLGDEASRDRFLFRLQEYARLHPAHRVTVFFDGQRASRRVTAGVEERITSGNRPADDVIVDFLRDLPAPDRPRAILVTDDRELGNRARSAGVRSEGVSWLASRFTEPTAQPRPSAQQRGLSQSELSEWEDFFRKPPQRPGRK